MRQCVALFLLGLGSIHSSDLHAQSRIPELVDDLRDDHVHGNALAAERLLSRMGQPALDALIPELDSPDPQVRRFATRIAMRLCVEGGLEIPDALADRAIRSLYYVQGPTGRRTDVNLNLMTAFFGRDWPRFRPRLERALEDPDARIATWSSLLLLEGFDRPPPRAFEVAFRGLEPRNDFHVADCCVRALYRHGGAPVKELINRRFASEHARAIGQLILEDLDTPLRPHEPFRALVAVAIDGLVDDSIRLNRRDNMSRLRAFGVDAIPYLEGALDSQDRQQRTSVLTVLQSVISTHGTRPSEAVLHASVIGLEESSFRTRRAFLSRHIDVSRPHLVTGLSSKLPRIRFGCACILAMRRVTSCRDEVIDTLVEFLDDNVYAYDAMTACHALYQYGESARPRLLKHYDRAEGQRRRALELVLLDLESPPRTPAELQSRLDLHGLSKLRADPCVQGVPYYPRFHPRRSPIERVLELEVRIEPVAALLAVHGRSGVDWRYVRGTSPGYATIEIGPKGVEFVPVVRVRYSSSYRATVAWQPAAASQADAWEEINGRAAARR